MKVVDKCGGTLSGHHRYAKLSINIGYVLVECQNMGNIKTRMIKRTALQLVDSYPELFSKDFAANKKIVSQLIQADSDKTLNKVAGYVTRLVRRKEREKETPVEV
jgi:small subunit ribosomal protein S17e